jgi:hypothetical protein
LKSTERRFVILKNAPTSDGWPVIMTAAPSTIPTSTRGRTSITRYGTLNDRRLIGPAKRLEIFLAGIQKFSRPNVLVEKIKKIKKKKPTNPHVQVDMFLEFDPFSIRQENFHKSSRKGNRGVTVGPWINLI